MLGYQAIHVLQITDESSLLMTHHYWFVQFGSAYLFGSLAAWEGPQLLIAKVKNASGRIGIFDT